MLRRRHVGLIALLLVVCLVYANSFQNSFHFDDFHAITDNPAVRSLGNLPRIFTDARAFSVLPANQTYRPVVTASLALDYALGGGYAPFWFHLSTLFWFLVLIALLYFLFELLFDRIHRSAANRWLALGGAAWFGLHPAMAETVNYIIQRGDLYCTLGCVAGLFVFARWPRLRRFGLYLAPFVAAMLSKPPAAVFPALLLLYVLFFETSTFPPAKRWRVSAVAVLPALALTGLLLWVQSLLTPKSFAPSIIPAADYRMVQPYVWLRYFCALFLPLHLDVDTDLQPIARMNGEAWAGMLFVLGLAAVIVVTVRRRRWYPVCFGLLWFVITQLPTSLYPLSEVENDHRMFFSFPGLMLAVVWSLYLCAEWVRRRVFLVERHQQGVRVTAGILAGLCLCGYAYGAHRRNQVWRSEDTLWADDVAKSPHNGRGLMIYGLTRMHAGDLARALALYQRALIYTPNYPTLEINLGVVNGRLAAQGNPALQAVAEQHFQRAIALAPDDDTAHAYYGRWLLREGRVAEAIAQLQRAVALNPQREMQRELLITAYEQSGDTGAARRMAEETLRVMPGDATALAVARGRALPFAAEASELIDASLVSYRAGRFQQSVEQAKQALALDPHSAEAWNNIGAGYGAMRQWEVAIDAEEHALQLNPNLQIARNNLHWFEAQKAGGPGSSGQSASGPMSAGDYVNLSLRLDQQGRYRESLAAARRAVGLDPRSAEAWNNVAAANEGLKRWDQAIAAAQRAVALRSDFQLAKNNLAWSMQQKAHAAGR